MKSNLESYRQSREVLLTSIITELSADEHCIAAWLTGSYARNDADEVSDLDIRVVIAEPYSDILCARQEQVSHSTTSERLAFFSRFGQPALIHENNNNAPEGGTFTFVLYSDSALMVDWTLLPQMNAERPFQSLLLFDKANLPLSPPPEAEELEQSKKAVAEMWAFFWMMTAVTIKYIIRNDSVFVNHWLEVLHGLVEEIGRQLRREPSEYIRGSLTRLEPTPEKQIESIRSLCRTMQELTPQIEQFSGVTLAPPRKEIETLLVLASEEHARD
ncbi:MAG TPA: nucleotidyltransferase domain-containing protein [Anaerolineales bacterium]|nr:nucleotidyltransferase domain-containing protein [Anaerolineales bacterium]